MQYFPEETPAQKIDGIIFRALHEIRGVPHGLSRGDFARKVQLRVDKDLGPGSPVRDRVHEILDPFRDDSL